MREKMRISAVICELDPLHWGHRLLLSTARHDADALVCIMSGQFVQRGQPAMVDKWARARMALCAGADLVVELPLSWACAGAERFAQGGVALASAVGADRLFFGSETCDINLIKQTAKALLSPDFSQELQALPQDGATFAYRRQQALERILGPGAAALIQRPNALLGVEYCKAIFALGAELEPVAIPRRGAGHNSTAGPDELCAASQLREMLWAGEDIQGLVPSETYQIIQEETKQGRCPAGLALCERAVLSRLRALGPEGFACLPDISEGLENRLHAAARQACTLEELYARVKSKRYTLARVRRLVMSAFLGLQSPLPDTPPALRVLGLTQRGSTLLKGRRLPVALRPRDFQRIGGEAWKGFQLEAAAGDLYALCTPTPQPCGRDFSQPVIKG